MKKTVTKICLTLFLLQSVSIFSQTKQDTLDVRAAIDEILQKNDLYSISTRKYILRATQRYGINPAPPRINYSEKKARQLLQTIKQNDYDFRSIGKKNKDLSTVLSYLLDQKDFKTIEKFISKEYPEIAKSTRLDDWKAVQKLLIDTYYKQQKWEKLYKFLHDSKNFSDVRKYMAILRGEADACDKFIAEGTNFYTDGSSKSYTKYYSTTEEFIKPFCDTYLEELKKKNEQPVNPFLGDKRLFAGSFFYKNMNAIEKKLNITSTGKSVKDVISSNQRLIAYKSTKANYEILFVEEIATEITIIPNDKLEFSLEGDLGKIYKAFIADYTGVAAFDGMEDGTAIVNNPIDKTRYIELPYRIGNSLRYEVKENNGQPLIIHHFYLDVALDKYFRILSEELNMSVYHLKEILNVNESNDSIRFNHVLTIYSKDGYVEKAVIK